MEIKTDEENVYARKQTITPDKTSAVASNDGLPCPDCHAETMEITKHPDREEWGYYHRCALTGKQFLDWRETKQELEAMFKKRWAKIT